MLYNGYGEHNIQGIGDKHIPLIHNVTNTDVAVAVSDHATDQLFVLFNDPAGLALLRGRGVGEDVLAALPHFGLSSICNIVAAIKTAKTLGLGASQALITVATDGAELYTSEFGQGQGQALRRRLRRRAGGRDLCHAHHAGRTREHVLPLTEVERRRIFNLGYFTWVEQRGIELADFRGPARPELLAWPARLAAGMGCADRGLQQGHRHELSGLPLRRNNP